MCSFYIFNERFPFFLVKRWEKEKEKERKVNQNQPGGQQMFPALSVAQGQNQNTTFFLYIYVLLLCNRKWACLVLVWYQFIGQLTIDNFSMNLYLSEILKMFPYR